MTVRRSLRRLPAHSSSNRHQRGIGSASRAHACCNSCPPVTRAKRGEHSVGASLHSPRRAGAQRIERPTGRPRDGGERVVIGGIRRAAPIRRAPPSRAPTRRTPAGNRWVRRVLRYWPPSGARTTAAPAQRGSGRRTTSLRSSASRSRPNSTACAASAFGKILLAAIRRQRQDAGSSSRSPRISGGSWAASPSQVLPRVIGNTPSVRCGTATISHSRPLAACTVSTCTRPEVAGTSPGVRPSSRSAAASR